MSPGGSEIAPGVYSIGQRKGGRVHAFLFDADPDLVLVDTLFDTDGARIEEEIARIGRQVSELRHILLTHAHRSHLGGLAALKEASGATVYAHEWEADIVSGDRKAQAVTLVPKRPLRTYFPFQVGCALGLGRHPPCPVDETVADGDRVGPLHIVHTPGHSPGHLAFHWPERRVLVAGDAVVTWPDFGAGWPAFTLNPKQHRASLRRMAALDAEVVGVGHGEPITTRGGERVRDLADRLGE